MPRSSDAARPRSSQFAHSPTSIPSRRIGMALGLALLLAVALTPAARADRRLFAWTYEPQTLDRGEAELESYSTFSAPDLGHAQGQTTTQHQLELEIGMTDRFDFAIYQVFEQPPAGAMTYEGYKLRFRHRLGDGKGFPLASVAYLEYEGRPDFTAEAVEAKLLLGRGLGRCRLAINPLVEFKPGGGKWKTAPGYAVGLAWQASDLASLGLEAKGDGDAHYLGPVVAHGVGDLWMALGSGFRLNDTDEEPELQARLLLGVKVH